MFFASFFQMARRRCYWSPKRLIRILWSMLSNISLHWDIFRTLANPSFKGLLRLDPVFPFKHLSTCYLVRGLSASERAFCFLYHYKKMQDFLPSKLLRTLMQTGFSLFETKDCGTTYSVTVGFPPREAIWEGELALRLLVDGEHVYVLQFSIVPGRIVHSEETSVLLVLRLQGVKGSFDQVRTATKALNEVAPPALLMATLQGLAKAWNIRQFAGVCATSQYSYSYSNASPDTFKGVYDNFFIQLGANRVSADFFSSPIPVEEKPVENVKNGHKARTRKKRAFKLKIADEAYRRMVKGRADFVETPDAETDGFLPDPPEHSFQKHEVA